MKRVGDIEVLLTQDPLNFLGCDHNRRHPRQIIEPWVLANAMIHRPPAWRQSCPPNFLTTKSILGGEDNRYLYIDKTSDNKWKGRSEWFLVKRHSEHII